MKLRDGWHASGMPGDFGMELFEGDLERIMVRGAALGTRVAAPRSPEGDAVAGEWCCVASATP